MNVLIIINSFRLGGAEKMCYDLALKLSHKPNLKVFLYSIGKVETELEYELYKSFEKTPVIVGSFEKPYKKRRFQTAIKIKHLCQKQHINIIHTNGQSPDLLARLSRVLGNRSKIIVTIHNTVGYSKKIESIFSKFTDTYTAVSKDAIRYSKEELAISKKIELIENAIDLTTYTNIDKDDRVFEILSVGRVQPQKDYIKAARFLGPFLNRHRDVKWIIYGDHLYDENYTNEFRTECLCLGIENSVVFKGVVTDPKEIYKHGNVFVLASSFEGFGIAFIEAIMSGHFIFSRDVGVIKEIIKNGGIIHNIDDDNSLKKLDAVYYNAYNSDEIELNKEIVSNLYSLDTMVEKYIAIYKNTLRVEHGEQ